jgi:L-lactate dehydrogenase complex protein LldG
MDLAPALAAEDLAVIAAPGGGGEADRRRHRDEAARAGLGVTGVDLAVAETGTLILLSGAGRPRSTSLLPETHVAVFGPRALVESLEQVGVILEALHVDPARSMSGAVINFITGPSRTADIELTLTRGVHGPKYVHAVFVDALDETPR